MSAGFSRTEGRREVGNGVPHTEDAKGTEGSEGLGRKPGDQEAETSHDGHKGREGGLLQTFVCFVSFVVKTGSEPGFHG